MQPQPRKKGGGDIELTLFWQPHFMHDRSYDSDAAPPAQILVKYLI